MQKIRSRFAARSRVVFVIVENDMAITYDSSQNRVFYHRAQLSGAAENPPEVIKPDDAGAGTMRWHVMQPYSAVPESKCWTWRDIPTAASAVPIWTVDSVAFPNGALLMAVSVEPITGEAAEVVYEEWTDTLQQVVETLVSTGEPVTVREADIDNRIMPAGSRLYLKPTTREQTLHGCVWYVPMP
jgi:hypothetical protein